MTTFAPYRAADGSIGLTTKKPRPRLLARLSRALLRRKVEEVDEREARRQLLALKLRKLHMDGARNPGRQV